VRPSLSWGRRPLQSPFSRPRSALSASRAPSVDLPSRAHPSRSSATGPPSRALKPEKDPLLRFDSPSEYCRGAPPERLSPSCRRLSPALGSVSPGVLSPYDAVRSRRPVSYHGRLDRPRETRVATPSPGSALGLSQPPGGFSSVLGVRRTCPGCPVHAVAPKPPWSSRSLVPCRERPWDSPFRAFPSRGAVPPFDGLLLPCGFDVDRA
jgi:hypothetical protein